MKTRLLGGAIMLSVLAVFEVVSKTRYLAQTQWKHRLSSEQRVDRKNRHDKYIQNGTGSFSFSMNQNEECSRFWGTFVRNETFLTETQFIRQTLPPPPINDAHMEALLEDLFIDPATNFAFCGIAKNAVSQWKTVLRNVHENRTSQGFQGPDYKLHLASQNKHGKQQARQILTSPDSTVVIVVRDPLARFASAYLGKCFADNCTNRACRARRSLQRGRVISFRQALDWILSPNVNVSKCETHWKLQSARCGISEGALDTYFNIIGKMTKETLAKDAACLMKHAGLDRFNIPASPTTDTSATFWNAGGTPQISYRTEKEENVLRKLYTPDLAQQLMTKYQQDYDIFQLPEPKWVSQATGEWLDSLNHHSCRK